MKIKDVALKYLDLFEKTKKGYIFKKQYSSDYKTMHESLCALNLGEESVCKWAVKCLEWIIEVDPKDIDELNIMIQNHEYKAAELVDIYTYDLVKWLAKFSSGALGYVNLALNLREEKFQTIDQLLRYGQFLAICTVFRGILYTIGREYYMETKKDRLERGDEQ